jgi:hypothetical protein
MFEVQGTLTHCSQLLTYELHDDVVFQDEVQGTVTYSPEIYTNELHGHESDVFVTVEVHQSPYDHSSRLFTYELHGQEVELLVEIGSDEQGPVETSCVS